MLNKLIISWEPGEEELLFKTLSTKHVGGIILFRKHIGKNISDFLSKVKKASKNRNLVISVDQEGGSVRRFTDDDIFVMGAREAVSFLNPIQYRTELQIMAQRLSETGITMILGPVIDIVLMKSNILWDRSYGSLDSIDHYGSAFVEALTGFGITPCIKHFFGYGLASPDPHKHIHRIPEDFELDIAISPFRSFAKRGYQGAIMTAHTHYENEIITYSQRWVKGFLKETLGLRGPIITDDLMMASAGDFPLKERIKKAIDAGHDLCIVSGSLANLLQSCALQ